MKPDWSTAPDFARYLAQDKEGALFWFQDKPSPGTCVWMSRDQAIQACVANPNWRDTLEERPVHNEHETEGK